MRLSIEEQETSHLPSSYGIPSSSALPRDHDIVLFGGRGKQFDWMEGTQRLRHVIRHQYVPAYTAARTQATKTAVALQMAQQLNLEEGRTFFALVSDDSDQYEEVAGGPMFQELDLVQHEGMILRQLKDKIRGSRQLIRGKKSIGMMLKTKNRRANQHTSRPRLAVGCSSQGSTNLPPRPNSDATPLDMLSGGAVKPLSTNKNCSNGGEHHDVIDHDSTDGLLLQDDSDFLSLLPDLAEGR